MEHNRYDYSPIIDRAPLKLPGGAHVGLWVILNIEHFLVGKPSTSITTATINCDPDVLNYAWRDFGVRVGIWRLMDVLEKHGIRGTVALNSDVCLQYPRIIGAGNDLGWEWMGHGRNNSEMITGIGETEERAILSEVYETITEHTGTRPRGWLGPALTETANTPDILAETGFDYVGDWVNDEQPYELTVKSGRLLSVPYSIEVNDIPAFVDRGWSAEQFYQTIVDQFDVLYQDGETNGRIMAIALHPFLIGHGFRSKYLDKALSYITGHDKVWLATGSEIADWYRGENETVGEYNARMTRPGAPS